MITRISSDSTVLPLSVAEVKEHLRIDSTYEDELVRSMTKAVTLIAENRTGRALVQREYEMLMDDFPSSTEAITLLYPPLSATSGDLTITYLDETSGNSTTFPATAYTVDYKSEPARVYPSYNNEWPDNVRDVPNAVTITYRSGYSTCPEPIKSWMKLQIGVMYENREGIIPINMNKLSRSFFDGLLDGYALPGVY